MNNDEIKNIYSILSDIENQDLDKREECLNVVKSLFNNDDYQKIIKYIQDCDYTRDFEIITKKPSFKKDEDKIGLGLWVDQYCNGGYSGDDFAGWIYIKISKKQYLKFHYSM